MPTLKIVSWHVALYFYSNMYNLKTGHVGVISTIENNKSVTIIKTSLKYFFIMLFNNIKNCNHGKLVLLNNYYHIITPHKLQNSKNVCIIENVTWECVNIHLIFFVDRKLVDF